MSKTSDEKTFQQRLQDPMRRADNRIARREVRAGLSPLEILTEMSRHYYKEWESDPKDKDFARLAMTTAEKAAPYMHAKRASVQNEHNIKGELTVNIGGKTGDL